MKNFIKKIPGIRWFLDIRRELALIRFQLTKQTRIQQHIFREQLISRKTESGSGFPLPMSSRLFPRMAKMGFFWKFFPDLESPKALFWKLGRVMETKTTQGFCWNSAGVVFGSKEMRLPARPLEITLQNL